ncbi:hypothetical protein DV515_00009974 [Chloebia gouldiae]|uniref:Uncharacterized protein n=1 Tax=Chloebia gouldiae TaxID=44316 RepID=A0A3L8SBE0_CHLGU|nr:hypothetical protein DV515_00009974 [Chloebia gouldiae]
MPRKRGEPETLLVWISSKALELGCHGPGKKLCPTTLEAQERGQVRILSQHNPGALEQCSSQEFSGHSSSKLLGAANYLLPVFPAT